MDEGLTPPSISNSTAPTANDDPSTLRPSGIQPDRQAETNQGEGRNEPASSPGAGEEGPAATNRPEAPTLEAAGRASEAGHFHPGISQALGVLLEEMHALRQDFTTKIKFDESKERQMQMMHAELQAYREDLHFRILRPLFADLIGLHDQLSQMMPASQEAESDESTRGLRRLLVSLQESIEDTLQRNGVESYTSPEDVVVPARQLVLKVIKTSDQSLENKIARRLRKGFQYEGKILRPEWVEVYRCISAE